MCQDCQIVGQQYHYRVLFVHPHPGQQHVNTGMPICHSTSSTMSIKVLCLCHGVAVVSREKGGGADLEQGLSWMPPGDGWVV